MDRNIIKNIADRLNIHDELVLRKSEEYARVYQSRVSIKNINDQAKTILCLDLAAHALGQGFDKEVALGLSGLKKSAYQNSLHTIEKMLGLDKSLTVSDVCVQLACTAIKEDAEDILAKYKKINKKIKDLDHPQYVAAATYLACKAKRIGIDKSKIVSLSRLKPSQWRELLSHFESLGINNKNIKAKENAVEDDNGPEVTETQQILKKDEVEDVEGYDVWKERILKEAYTALKKESLEMQVSN